MMPTNNFATDLTDYQRAWTSMMLKIWEEKLLMLGVYRSGALVGSLSGATAPDLIIMRFLQYGVYVDTGVGYAYKGHGGDIEFLGEAYREEHGLNKPRKVGPAWGGGYTSGKPRQKKAWFNRKYYASVMRMKEDMAQMAGDAFVGIVQSIGTKA